MAHSIRELGVGQVHSEVQKLLESPGLPFRDILSPERIQTALENAGVTFRERIYTPAITIWAFLSQILTTKGTCQTAVARVLVDRLEAGLPPCSVETTSYCQARQRLPEAVISGLATDIGKELHDQAPVEWKFKGRDVEIVDGSTARLADTPENQLAYPQSRTQKPGLGSPLLRFVVLLSLSVGSALACAIGPCRGKKTGEQSLFREIRDQIKSGTILLGDCLYDSYRDIADLLPRGVDVVFGMKQSRKSDFRRGRKLGADDHVVLWMKPKYDKSRFESREHWESLPESMEIRETRLHVTRKGFRTRVIMVVTTLLDAETYTKQDLMHLFQQRWHCELDLRSIKCGLGMKDLKCETPEMVRKELWMHLLAYNCIRVRMAQAAALHNVQPRKLSFKSALAFHQEFMPAIQRATAADQARLEREMLKAMAQCKVGDRPGRKEPRAIKKRVQKYANLTKPRVEARKGLTA
jgi:hypothetical protein